MAEAYADALSVSAPWLLYGEDPTSPEASIRKIRVAGVARRNVWIDKAFNLPIDYEITFDASGYEGIELSAYQIGDDSTAWPIGSFAITADTRLIGLSPGDQILGVRERGSLYELSIREILMDGPGPHAYLNGPAINGHSRDYVFLPTSPKATKGETVSAMHAVIGIHWKRPNSRQLREYAPPPLR